MSSCESRSTTRSSSDSPSVRLRELVVEEIVVRLERPASAACAASRRPAVDVEVREDAQQPRAEIRPGLVRAPASERARVRLLDELVGVLARVREVARDAVHLIGERERLFLEAHAVARLGRDARAPPTRLGSSRCRLSHEASVPPCSMTPERGCGDSRSGGIASSRKPALAHRREQRLTARLLVVPRERDLAHERSRSRPRGRRAP